jgi:ATP-dependent DNA helicase DinG
MDRAAIDLRSVFGPDGYIAMHKPGYEVRAEQVKVAETVERAIRDGQNALIEAGTGTGKSFALLVPAIMSKKRTVISTETNTLLDQYVLKDLPFLKKVLPEEFSFAKAKGKGNFVCKKKLDDYLANPLISGFADVGEVEELVAWALRTASGDKSEPSFKFSEGSWQTVGCDELCSKKQCRYYGNGAKGDTDCFAYQARSAFLKAQVVVTNHTLCLLNAQIGSDVVLGPHEIMIFDEAHTLVEQAQKTFGFELKQRAFSGFGRYALKVLKASNLDIEFDLAGLEWAESTFFECFRSITKQQMTFPDMPTGLRSDAGEAAKPVIAELDKLRKELNTKSPMCEEDEDLLSELDSRAIGHIKSLEGLFEPEENWLPFAEVSGDLDARRVTLHYKPVDVAPILKKTVYEERKSTVMASATIAIGSRFDFFSSDIGLIDPLTLRVDSPFDYVNQCTGYYPTHLPDPTHPEYHTRVAEEIERVLIHSNGRAFVLFTSYRDLARVYELVSSRLRYNIYRQGDLPKPALIKRFKEDVHSVLFATRSFFTGVDIPGEALSCVILVKAPFRPPDEPLFSAKCKLIKSRGGNDFQEYALPLMVNDLRQAFGRLIRSKSDTGLFAFLDSRAINKPYFRMITNSLPAMKVRTTL